MGGLTSRLGGFTSPSTKLVGLPSPGKAFPGIAEAFQSMMSGLGGQTGATLGEAMKTGLPTDVGPAFEALVAARQRGNAQGRNNIIEAMGESGLRYGSSMQNALVDYELQSQKDLSQILADFTRQSSEGAADRRLQSSMFSGAMFKEAGTTTYPTAALATGPSPLSQGADAMQSGLMMMLALGLIGK